MRMPVFLRYCLVVVPFLAGLSQAQTRPDVVVFDEDDAVGVGYYDASVPGVTAPSLLTTYASPNGGKLTILTDHKFSGAAGGLLEWKSMPGGDWIFFVASPGFQIRDLTGYSNLVLFVNGPVAIPAAALPKIGLESSSNQRTATTNLAGLLPSGMDGDPNTWQRIKVPLSAFQPYGSFSPAQFKDVFCAQNLADGVVRTVWLDNLRVTDGHVPAAVGEVVTRAGDRSVVLHWPRNSEPDIAGYAVFRGPTVIGPFALLNPTLAVLPSYADFAVTNGQNNFYLVRAVNQAGEESPNSMVVNATPHAFANDAEFLEYVEQTAFDYFWYEAHPTNGLVRDRSQPASVVSIAAVGFGLTGIGIAIDHGWITRAAGRQRVLTTLRTFRDGPQGPNVSGTIGYKGWFYHMLKLNTATRDGDSELSSIDSGLLLAGILYVREFFDQNQPDENEIRSAADTIFNRVDWLWMVNGGNSLTMGWKPESGFLPWRWIGYNEAMVLYVMGLGAATNPLPPAQWSSWTSGYNWRTNYGQAYVEFPPMFGHQYSHCWIDFRHLADAYMNSRASSYFENTRRAALAQRAYCIANPGGFVGYGSNVWGLTACDGPGFGEFAGYTARGAPPAMNDDGTIAPTAVSGCLPFAPEICLPTLRHFYDQYRTNIWTGYGFCDAFNLTANWWDPDVLGIDQGGILIMVENYRTQNVWRRFTQCLEIQRGLLAAGFTELPFVATGIQRGPAAGAFTLSWASTLNRSYQVEYSPNLRDWFISPTGFLTGNGALLNWMDVGPPATDSSPAVAAERFYRVFRLGPP
jgi:hypothetical protein